MEKNNEGLVEVKWIQVLRCPLCEFAPTTASKFIVWHRTMLKSTIPSIPIQYVMCPQCNFIFQNPRLIPEQADDIYDGLLDQLYGKTEENHLIATYGRALCQARLLAKRIKAIKYHLDDGCHFDILQREIKLRFDVTDSWGTEISSKARDLIHSVGGKSVPTIDDLPEYLKGQFDLITASHVLEHVQNPVIHLFKYRQWASDDCTLFIEVPVNGWDCAYELDHLSVFSPHTLKEALLRAGWKPIKIWLTGEPSARITLRSCRALARKGKAVEHKIRPEGSRRIGIKNTLTFVYIKTMSNLLSLVPAKWRYRFLDLPTHPMKLRKQILEEQKKFLRQSEV